MEEKRLYFALLPAVTGSGDDGSRMRLVYFRKRISGIRADSVWPIIRLKDYQSPQLVFAIGSIRKNRKEALAGGLRVRFLFALRGVKFGQRSSSSNIYIIN